MSDPQCAATVVVLPADQTPDIGRLRSMRPVAVRAGAGAGDAATGLALSLDVAHEDLPDDTTTPTSLTRALDELADEYRGECVAVVVASSQLRALTRLVLPERETGAVVVEIDADGRRWAVWPAALSDARGR